jgi:photosystem II stability/assembly factor-like uncharacterized protein
MNKFKLVFGLIIFFSVSSRLNAQWEIVQSGTTLELTSIYFTDSLNGYIVGGEGLILKTNNGGHSWSQYLSNTIYPYWNVFFIDSINGWACGSGIISRTSNGGITWELTELSGDYFYLLNDVYFSSLNNGVAGGVKINYYGYYYYVIRTSNGGQVWEEFSIPNLGNVEGVYFTSDSSGFIICWQGILRTLDGGYSWETAFLSNWKRLFDIDFYNRNCGFAVGDDGLIVKTSDGGNRWQEVNTNIGATLYDVVMIDSNKIFATTVSGKLVYSLNGGLEWLNISEIDSFHINDIYFIDENNGWAVGGNGTILHTTNGGVTFVEDERFQNVQPTDFSLSQNYPNPFNPSTTISWQSPVNSHQTLKVYDVLGNEVASLVNEFRNAGSYEVDFNASSLSSGIYFYKLQAGSFIQTKKMISLK